MRIFGISDAVLGEVGKLPIALLVGGYKLHQSCAVEDMQIVLYVQKLARGDKGVKYEFLKCDFRIKGDSGVIPQ